MTAAKDRFPEKWATNERRRRVLAIWDYLMNERGVGSYTNDANAFMMKAQKRAMTDREAMHLRMAMNFNTTPVTEGMIAFMERLVEHDRNTPAERVFTAKPKPPKKHVTHRPLRGPRA